MEILKLTPAFKDYIWGGQQLKSEYKVTDLDRVSEAWVLSCHKDGASVVEGGEYDGKTLTEVLSAAGKEVLGSACDRFERFPVLIKLIDAAQNLSVQVHPDDEYALRVEKEYGKTEMWYIVAAKEGAGIYYGFKDTVTKEEFRKSIENNTLTELLEFVPVKAGESYFIPAGTIHAIGAGLLIAEVQQNSNTTYRVYDYGRVGADGKPRDLHIEKALDVTALTPAPKGAQFGEAEGMKIISQCGYFRARALELDGERTLKNGESFMNLLVLSGEGSVNGRAFRKNDSFFVPAGAEAVLSGNGSIIVTDVTAE